MDMGRGEERVRCVETYITMCKIDSENLLCGSGNSNRGSVSTWRGEMGKKMGGRFKSEGIYIYL